MTSNAPQSAPSDPQPNPPNSQRGMIVATSIGVVATVFSLFFVMGFVSAWLKSEGVWTVLIMRGLKFAASGSIGVLCIGISAKSWQRLAVPAWLPSTRKYFKTL